jgi:predicted ester cyclase
VPAEENKAIFRRYVEEVPNQGNLDVADEIFGRYVAHQADGATLERGPEYVKRFTDEYRSAFPDWRISIDEQIVEGDKVVNRVTLRGTHQRQFRRRAARLGRCMWGPPTFSRSCLPAFAGSSNGGLLAPLPACRSVLPQTAYGILL